MSDERLRALEISVASLTVELRGHIEFCSARWKVAWKLASGISALVAAIVSFGMMMIRSQ